ncbi:MAG TPA: head-tail adaptor protein [Dokdonella sp.]
MIDPGELTHVVTVQSKVRTKTSGGGWTEDWTPLASASSWWCKIESASARAMERIAGGGAATVTDRTCVLEGRYHSGIKTGMRLVEANSGRVFNITSIDNVRSEDETSRILAEEVVTP